MDHHVFVIRIKKEKEKEDKKEQEKKKGEEICACFSIVRENLKVLMANANLDNDSEGLIWNFMINSHVVRTFSSGKDRYVTVPEISLGCQTSEIICNRGVLVMGRFVDKKPNKVTKAGC